MKKNLVMLFLAFCVIAGCDKTSDKQGDSSVFEIVKVYERGPLTVNVKVDKSVINIAQTINLELQASLQQGYEIQMPQVAEELKDFGIVDWQNLGSRLGNDNNIITACRYRLEPFISGKFDLPSFKFAFFKTDDSEQIRHHLETEPIAVEVTSLIGEDRANLVIEDIEDVVQMSEKPSYWLLWVIGVLILLLSGWAWFKARQKKLRKLIRIFKPAHEIAYARLRALEKENLIAAGKVKEFYERISDILRRYIEDRFQLRAPERTTEEFLVELSGSNQLSSSDKYDLRQFLEHCDLVKFAKFNPAAEQIQKTFELVEKFIEKTKSDEHKIDITRNFEVQEHLTAGKM